MVDNEVYRRKMFNLGLKVSDGAFHDYHRREYGSRQARMALEK